MAEDFKKTLNLPKTAFPMRASLVEREPGRIEHWNRQRLYSRIQEKNRAGEPFILHDGPPFTNGDVHIGTALNKVLKDIILRYESMRGRRAPYLPGWDCHGLPIEFKVSRQLQAEDQDLDPAGIRAACAEFSRGFIERQRAQFQRLGILADWSREYRTMDPAYEGEILRVFATFVEKGMVYRSKKPVLWSIPCATALAEAEIEYRDHTSPSIYVKFPLGEAALQKLELKHPASVVIWTTTPWTLPSNLAVAVHPELEYAFVESAGETFIVAAKLVERVAGKCQWEDYRITGSARGSDLGDLAACHPFIDRPSPILAADYVTTEAGTGLVHTAPGHGLEDYLSGRAHGLEIYSPLDDEGKYIDDGRIPRELIGLSVLEASPRETSPANIGVLKLTAANGTLLAKEKYLHSYPHCWRSKTPVVFRAMDQWFVSLDHDGMRQKLLDAIPQVRWVPAWAQKRFEGAVASRPDWTISRQRSWGVPIPCFFDEAGEPLLDASVARAIADKVAQHGTDIWFTWSAEQLLDGIPLPLGWEDRKLTPGRDTLDVWIDSGSSHRAVLARNPELQWPADLYLEGSDQHRGWFQSSAWTGIVTEGALPYKTVLTHGFIVDLEGQKVSKSGDKPMTADSFIQRYGADVVRLWISSQDYRDDIPVSAEILDHVAQAYRTFRNTLRFQLSNLYDFDPEHDLLPVEQLWPLDRWALHGCAELIAPVTEAFEAREFHRVYQLCNRFVAVTLSATYHDILKDRLYTYAATSAGRRSAQTALHHIFRVLNRLLAPVLLFTADEAWSFQSGGEEFRTGSVHLEPWPDVPEGWFAPELAEQFDWLWKVRATVNEKLERLRQEKRIGQSLEATVRIEADLPGSPVGRALESFREHLPELFIVSEVVLDVGGPAEPLVSAQPSDLTRCPRCWRHVAERALTESNPVCLRCAEALSSHQTV